ncbi:MAG: hypothetical protein ACRDNH_14685 [Gaiellaceae bacterium]
MGRREGDGVVLAVRDEGEGTPVLLLHGFPDPSNLWRNQIPALGGASLPAIALGVTTAAALRGFL